MNKIFTVWRSAIALVGVLVTAQVHAWGEDGHRIVGEIAWHHLEPEVANEVKLLLQTTAEPNLAEAATWADRIRSNDQYDWAAPLHYINLPRQWDGHYEEARDCPANGCIIKAIAKFQQVLGDRNRNKKDRAQALLFIVHFIGDLHQPMHTGLYEDKGGNEYAVQFFDIDTNLHALWDVHLLSRLTSDWKTYAEQQIGKITAEQRQQWQSTGATLWARESHQLAHSLAYTTETQLGEQYFLDSRSTLAMRLQQGGVRLAAVLNKTLAEVEGANK